MRVGIAAALAFTMAAAEVCADTPYELQVGDHLRIRALGSTQEYVLERTTTDTLLVSSTHDDVVRRIPVDQVEEIDVRLRRSAGEGAMLGAAIGGGIGALLGAAYAVATWDDVNADCGEQFDELCRNTASTARLIGAIAIFGMPGLVIGGVVGASAPGKYWHPVKLSGTLSLGIDSDGALLVQYSRAFR